MASKIQRDLYYQRILQLCQKRHSLNKKHNPEPNQQLKHEELKEIQWEKIKEFAKNC